MAGIKEVAGKAGTSSEVVREVLHAVKSIAAGGDKVQIKEFGTFEVKVTKARTGRNPKTNEKIAIPAGTRFTFKPSKEKKD